VTPSATPSATPSTIDPGAAAWSAVLPTQTSWVAEAAPWWLRARGIGRPTGGHVTRYVAIPSARSPLLVAAYDRDVLRHVADTVLSVPPGSGPLARAVLTGGRRLMRLRLAWRLAALAGLVRVVLVRRRG
jgi:hypothetical protein